MKRRMEDFIMENIIEVKNLKKYYKIPVRNKGIVATCKNLIHRKYQLPTI